MDFNEIYTLFAVIEKAAAHGSKYANIIAAAQAELDKHNAPPAQEEE